VVCIFWPVWVSSLASLKPEAGGASVFPSHHSVSFQLSSRICFGRTSLVTGTCSGFFVRIALDSSPNSVGIFTVEQLFIIVTPAAFLAFNYILYGRFIVNCVDPKYSLIRPNRVARLFVCSDIITFLIQACSC
jgi:RTA1 like protein